MDNLILSALCLLTIDIAVLGFIVINGFKRIEKEQKINKHDIQQVKVRILNIKRRVSREKNS